MSYGIQRRQKKEETTMRSAKSLPAIVAVVAACFASSAARAQPVPSPQVPPPVPSSIGDFGFEWATIGATGNTGYEGFGDIQSFKGFGSVNYNYRVSKTEVTATQYLEFVNAYAPFADDPRGSNFTGNLIFDFTVVGTGEVVYAILPGWEQAAMPMTWHMSARYVNWLHNGKVNNRAAFESGVYDTSTFGAFIDADGTFVRTDQRRRSDGAKFWIPDFNEWIKAAYYDPNKNGQGQEGYWQFPTTSDTAPIYDLPENGGESSGGARNGLGLFDEGPIPEVGWYPDVTSPWGIFDMSGGLSEWLEDVSFSGLSRHVEGGGRPEHRFLVHTG